MVDCHQDVPLQSQSKPLEMLRRMPMMRVRYTRSQENVRKLNGAEYILLLIVFSLLLRGEVCTYRRATGASGGDLFNCKELNGRPLR